MFCKFCGKEIPDDSSFCPACGNKVIAADINSNVVVPRSVPTETPLKAKKSKVIIIILSILLAAAVAASGYLYYIYQNTVGNLISTISEQVFTIEEQKGTIINLNSTVEEQKKTIENLNEALEEQINSNKNVDVTKK